MDDDDNGLKPESHTNHHLGWPDQDRRVRKTGARSWTCVRRRVPFKAGVNGEIVPSIYWTGIEWLAGTPRSLAFLANDCSPTLLSTDFLYVLYPTNPKAIWFWGRTFIWLLIISSDYICMPLAMIWFISISPALDMTIILISALLSSRKKGNIVRAV
jgi:hypothetical protein